LNPAAALEDQVEAANAVLDVELALGPWAPVPKQNKIEARTVCQRLDPRRTKRSTPSTLYGGSVKTTSLPAARLSAIRAGDRRHRAETKARRSLTESRYSRSRSSTSTTLTVASGTSSWSPRR